MVVDRGLTIEMDPEVAAAFEASTKTSVLHGAGVHMLKAGSKRRRTKAEIAESNHAEFEKDNVLRAKIARLNDVERQLEAQQVALDNSQRQLQENENAAVLVNDLMKAGIVRQESL